MSEINRRQPDYTRLLNLKALTTWTAERQSEHAEDARAYENALANFQTSLRSQHVEGDGRRSAARRSRKVERHLKALVKASRKAAKAAEDLRNAYATHVAHVQALPAQRQQKQVTAASRRDSLAELTGKSLHKTAQAAVQDGPAGGGQAPASSAPQAQTLADLWKGRSA